MTGKGPEARLEEKIEQLAVRLEEIRSLIESRPVLPEKLTIENLFVGQIDFNLESLNIREVSGAFNLGITNGVNLAANKKVTGIQRHEEKQRLKKTGPVHKNAVGASKTGPPKCKIHFSG